MPNVATYQILHGGSREIRQGFNNQSTGYVFDPPSNLVRGENLARLIILFEFQPLEKSRLRITLGNAQVEANYNKTNTRSGHRVFKFSDIYPSGAVSDPTPVGFRAITGRLKIKRPVIWYQIEV